MAQFFWLTESNPRELQLAYPTSTVSYMFVDEILMNNLFQNGQNIQDLRSPCITGWIMGFPSMSCYDIPRKFGMGLSSISRGFEHRSHAYDWLLIILP